MRRHEGVLLLFAIALAIAIMAALVTTYDQVKRHQATNDTPPGTTGVSRKYPPLGSAPGEPAPD
jgi:hypothetical protein